MILRAHAKINLALDVLRKRPDGYHEVRMIMQMTGMYDRLELTALPDRPGIHLTTNLPFVPANENNLAYRAAALLMEACGVTDGLAIDLKKFIPVSAGLAGGSTDAAAVLIGVNRLFRLGLGREQLMEYGARIGADVPYCVLGGTALSEGIGEILTPLPDMPSCHILLAKPPVSVSTKSVYQALKADEIVDHPDIDGMVEALKAHDLSGIVSRCDNVLERVTAPKHSVIGRIEEEMREAGALVSVMSGSGPTVFGIFDDEEKARHCRETLGSKIRLSSLFLTEPYNDGGGGRL